MEAPEFYPSGFFTSQFPNEKHHSLDSKPSNGGDHFIVEDLLDFSNEDAVVTDCVSVAAASVTTAAGNSTDSSTVTVVDSCNSSSFSGCEPCFNGDIGSNNFAPPDAHFGGDLCVPYDDLAELEWLSNFVEESFSSEDLQRLQLISGVKARPDESSDTGIINKNENMVATTNSSNSYTTANRNPIFQHEISVPAKARSKRSRAAPCNWASRLLVLSPTTTITTSSEPDVLVPPPQPLPNSGKKTVKVSVPKKRDGGEGGGNSDGRKCLHCATDKTPQWRTGPMGPKTLCNACGVRYKSGRLVPEYRPAASPTFVLTKHSNSHRKVLEIRRQKEMMRTQPHQQPHHHPQQFLQHHHHHPNMIFEVSNGDDYLIHQHVGPDFRQLI